MKKILYYLTLILSLSFFGGSVDSNFVEILTKQDKNQSETSELTKESDEQDIDEDGLYTEKDQVALYLRTYGRLPNNYITKREAIKIGFFNSKENILEQNEKISIGGDIFYNKEEVLETINNRIYFECDVNYTGGSRGKERIIYSNDGLIYYTNDHYETFTVLYGEDESYLSTRQVA
ncbi:ribonuclease domain-containing protein [Haloplasma contractile]|uniref:Ribonuclease n=1 Tax=Haloplasma contractile SSD-17B TaxID=1033810 RepID=F7PTP8_9MOLU|nr:ribonuclease domain-containing protein [Haloplasma contractile]ERJ12211.1 Ribonuclease secreted protein [Haloplasma contractile SSD-17B]